MAQADTIFPKSEKNAVLWFSFRIRIHLAFFHAASRASRSCFPVSSWDRSSNFVALGLRWWASPGQVTPTDGFLVSNVGMTHHGFSESTTSDWLQYVWALPQDRWRLRRLHIMRYATQLSCIWWVSIQNRSPCSLVMLILLQHSHCTCVTILFIPFAWLFVNLAVCVRALIPKFSSILGIVEQAFWRMPLFTEWSGASSFEVILARQSRHSSTWASGSSCIFHILLRRRSWRRIRLCRFCTLIFIVSETAIVSFWTLLVNFPLPTIS